MSSANFHQVIIVGAGPGGLAIGAALHDKNVTDVLILERGDIGQAWLDYPDGTRLLSESSPQHDDNIIAGVPTWDVLPHIPHPNHVMYKKYLEYVAQIKELKVQTNTWVEKVIFDHTHNVFVICTRSGEEYLCNYLVWAAGMFTHPNEEVGMEGCFIHYARIPYLNDITANEITVVGSANGATGVVLQLAKPGRLITLVTSREYVVPQPIDCTWKENMQFVKHMENQGLVRIVENFRVKDIYKENNKYLLISENGDRLEAQDRPIICTGFLANLDAVVQFVDQETKNHEFLLDLDEVHQSKKQPNLYFGGAIGKTTNEEGFIRGFRVYAEVVAQSIADKVSQN